MQLRTPTHRNDRRRRRLGIVNVHHRPHHGATNEWETPPEILVALGPFDDDPARSDSIEGFLRPWRGCVFLNPPYGPQTGEWLTKLADHGNGIALVFARTETRWFVETVWRRATSIFFIHGRPHFYLRGVRAQGNCGGPLVLVAYGEQADGMLRRTTLGGSYCEIGRQEIPARARLASAKICR